MSSNEKRTDEHIRCHTAHTFQKNKNYCIVFHIFKANTNDRYFCINFQQIPTKKLFNINQKTNKTHDKCKRRQRDQNDDKYCRKYLNIYLVSTLIVVSLYFFFLSKCLLIILHAIVVSVSGASVQVSVCFGKFIVRFFFTSAHFLMRVYVTVNTNVGPMCVCQGFQFPYTSIIFSFPNCWFSLIFDIRYTEIYVKQINK